MVLRQALGKNEYNVPLLAVLWIEDERRDSTPLRKLKGQGKVKQCYSTVLAITLRWSRVPAPGFEPRLASFHEDEHRFYTTVQIVNNRRKGYY